MNRLILSLAALSIISATAEVACTTVISDKATKKSYKYDLSRLSHGSGQSDVLYYRTTTGAYFYVNFCAPSSSACDGDDNSVCIRTADYDFFGSGKVCCAFRFSLSLFPPPISISPNPASQTSTQVISKTDLSGQGVGQGVVVSYSDGDGCTGGKRSAKIYVSCSASADPGFFYKVEEGTCNSVLYMWSASGCGKEVPYEGSGAEGSGSGSKKGGGIGAGGIILILLCVGVVVYLVGGAIFQWKVRGATTPKEMVPNREFWASIPSLVKDGVLFITHGFKKGDYVSI